MSSSSGESLLETELAASAFDAFPDDEIEFAIDAAGLLADAQVIDDLQTFPAIFDSGAGKAAIVGGALDEDSESLTIFNVVVAEPNTRLTLAQVRSMCKRSLQQVSHPSLLCATVPVSRSRD